MIFLDSWIFLEYFLREEKAKIAEKVIGDFVKTNGGLISAAVLLEVKYRIAKKFGLEKAEETVITLENIQNISILPVSTGIAKFAANLRIKYYSPERQLSFIDTINLATAISAGCKKFYTGDKDFEGVDEIKVEII